MLKQIQEITRDAVVSSWRCIANKYYTTDRGPQYFEYLRDVNETVSIDIFGPLPKTERGMVLIVVLMDHFFKFVKLYAMPDQKVDTLINLFVKQYFRDKGTWPQQILSDCAAQFHMLKWKQFVGKYGG